MASTNRLLPTIKKIYSEVKDEATLLKIDLRNMIRQYWNTDEMQAQETKLKLIESPRVYLIS